MRTQLALVVLLLVAGCGAGAGEDPRAAETPVAAPTLDDKWRGSMTVTPAVVAPGQQVALRFRSEDVRGIGFSLSAWRDQGWTVAYYLTSDWGQPDSHTPGWWSVADGEGRGWEDVGIGGPGPDHVVVPDVAAPGSYLLCTENSADEACAILTVTG